MRTTIKRLSISFVLISTLLLPNTLAAQNESKGEKIEKIYFSWSLTIQQVKAQVGASQQEFDVFNRFYKHTIDSIHIEFINKVNEGSITLDNVKEYVLNKKPFIINLFNNFRKIEQEFPSSVDEYKVEPKFRPGGDSCFSSCYNTGFENGTLDGWYGYYAVNNSNTSFDITNTTGGYCGHVTKAGGPDNFVGQNDYQIRITSGSTFDPFLQTYSTYSLPEVSPYGGTHSVMLGDSNTPLQGTAILSQSFVVTPSTSSLTYQFAVFLERNPTHGYYVQPLFSVAILDQNQDTISGCGNYQQSAFRAGEAGFNQTYYPIEGDTVYWKPWTLVNVPLKQYVGQCVTIVFEDWDCSAGGHFSYAYIDASCSPLQVLASSPNFCGQDSILLTAPPGDSAYRWTGPNGGIRGSDSGQIVSIDSAGIYRVIMLPVTGVFCADTLYDTIGKLPGPFPHPSFKADSVCAGTPTNFMNTSNPINGVFSWDFYNIGIFNYNDMSGDDTTWTYASAGTYTVKLHELANGCGLDTLEKVLVYPTVGAISHTAAPLCVDDSTLFTATATNATSYQWNFGDPGSGPLNTSDSENTGHVYRRAGTYTVTIKARAKCENDTSFTIIINPAPSPVVTGDTSICVNTNDVLTVTGGSSYIWEPGNYNGSTYTVTPANTTVYTVIATSLGCSGSTTFKVSTYPPPVASITPAVDTICLGDTVVLKGHGVGVYKWSTGGRDSSITVTPTKTTIYELRDSIKGSLCLSTTTATVVIRTPITNVVSHDTSVCPNQPVTITVSTSGEPALYKWNTGGTYDTINVAPSKTTTYTAVVSGIYCDHDTIKSTVNVVQLANPVFSGPTWRCKGIRDTLSVSSSNSPTTYLWSNGKTTTTIYTGNINADSGITVTAFNSLGCPVTITDSILLRQPPIIKISPPAIFCAGQPITLTASGSGTFPPYTYKWSTGQRDSSITINPGPDTTTTYTVQVSNGCINIKTTTVIPNVPNISACCNQVLYIEHDSANRHDTTILTASGNSKSYKWTEQPTNGVITCLDPSCDSVEVVTSTTTSYTVTGTDTNGCQGEQVLIVSIDIPCYDLTIPNVFTPNYPGPEGLNDVLYIKTQDMNAWDLTIFDRWGKQVYHSTNQYQYWDGNTGSGAKAADGVYYYVISATCQSGTYKKDGFVQLIR